MPAKMRLQRRGKKGMPFYHIVIADGRAPRDGRFIEKIGTYNPLTVPADIQINFDRALDCLQKGVQPTDTVRAILSYKGILYKYHLQKGVQKGALTQAQADNRFSEWLTAKEAKISAKAKAHEMGKKESHKHRLQSEVKIKEAREIEIAKKRAAEIEAEAEARAEVPQVVEPPQAEIRDLEYTAPPVAEAHVEEPQVVEPPQLEVKDLEVTAQPVAEATTETEPAEDVKPVETTEPEATEESEVK
jgi:small subunit ribosomal protein S16